jgi:iron complex outermembrane receptor protein
LTVGYTIDIPQVRRARIYVKGNNLFLLTPYSGFDPEMQTDNTDGPLPTIGVDYLNYPRPRTLTVGVNLGF